MSDDEARNAALVEFVGIFEDVSSAPTTLSDLSDGVALFEALSEMYVVSFCQFFAVYLFAYFWSLCSRVVFYM